VTCDIGDDVRQRNSLIQRTPEDGFRLGGNGQGQGLGHVQGGYTVANSPDAGAQQCVVQFANVPRPGMLEQKTSCRNIQFLIPITWLRRCLSIDVCEHRVDQDGEITLSLAQRWQEKNPHCQSMEEVLPEPTFPDVIREHSREGESEPIHIEETDTTFAIGWKGSYRIEGPAFIYSDEDTGRVATILGYRPISSPRRVDREISNMFG
jgi:hypothetical protein